MNSLREFMKGGFAARKQKNLPRKRSEMDRLKNITLGRLLDDAIDRWPDNEAIVYP